MRRSLALLFILGFVQCQRAETPEQSDARIAAESKTARAELTTLMGRWEKWVADGKVDSMASVMDENGMV